MTVQANNRNFFKWRIVSLSIGNNISDKYHTKRKLNWCKTKIVRVLGKRIYLVTPTDSKIVWKRYTYQIIPFVSYLDVTSEPNVIIGSYRNCEKFCS